MTFFANLLYFISFSSSSINCRFLNLKLVVVIQLVRVLAFSLYILFAPFFKDCHSYAETYSFLAVLFYLKRKVATGHSFFKPYQLLKEEQLEPSILSSKVTFFTGVAATAVTRCHSLPFVVTHCVTRCHSLSLVVPLVVTGCHSLSLVVICCHSLYHSLSFVVTRTTRCHLLSLDVPRVCLFINDRANLIF